MPVIIVRDRMKPSKQMQLVIDHEKQTIGVSLNAGLELLVIESGLTEDVCPTVKEY